MVFFVFLLGTIIGSFLNVLADRLPHGKSPWTGRSKCDYCHKTLEAWDLIPLLSFIWLGGKCRYCHRKLSFQYPFIEFLTGILFVFLFWYVEYTSCALSHCLTSSLSLFSLLVIFSSLLVIFVADLKYMIIPDEMLWSMLVGIILWHSQSHFSWPKANPPLADTSFYFSLLLTTFFSGLFFWLIYFVTRGRGLGFGDVKLAPLIGLFLGFPGAVFAFYIAFLTGAVISLILILGGKKKFGHKIPFGPFLILGTIISFFAHDQITIWVGQFL